MNTYRKREAVRRSSQNNYSADGRPGPSRRDRTIRRIALMVIGVLALTAIVPSFIAFAQ
jgi:hypothetical protein